ncbi:putative Phospholipase A2 phospholipin [Polypedilum vanderplanki]|uniref:phospholipase A2 n=1 Tax=Polypedilum vanderplanki TaxID=319348 RepID=A0A9J6CQ89_POLVA|nr:putative Phospholipase A2 phospholipin [Polypedilum vanderplanki]
MISVQRNIVLQIFNKQVDKVMTNIYHEKYFFLYIIVFIICIINQCTSISDLNHSNYKNENKNFTHHQQKDNFLIIDHLNDNERETRLKWKNLMGKETTLDMDNNERFVNSSLKLTSLWQLTDGKDFAQLIFNGNSLIDCENIDNGNDIIGDFVSKFIEEYQFIRHEKLSSTKHAKKHHQYQQNANLNEEVLKMKSNVKFIQLKKLQDIPEHLLRLMNLKKLKKQCNRLHKKIKQKLQQQHHHHTVDEEEDEEDFNAKNENMIHRTKRQTDSWFLAPNSKWCGSGSSANGYKELGPSKADTCCRRHDICKVNIPPLEKRYNLFNIRPFTISACRCDRRFRTCLKIADSNDSHLVGKLFFNIIQTKCFVLKSVQECILYSWWGKCLKFKTKKQAYLRDNPKY